MDRKKKGQGRARGIRKEVEARAFPKKEDGIVLRSAGKRTAT